MSKNVWWAAALSALMIVAAGVPVRAVERFVFATPGASDEVRDALLAASLLDAAIRVEGRQDPQEILAAARAEYARLVGALYAQGHYGGVVRIRIDGTEAADIRPLALPSQIQTVAVQVDPGPGFRFGTARIAPLAPGTAIPPGFATGQPAESGVIRKAAEAAVDGWRDVGHAKADTAGESIVAEHRSDTLNVEVGIAPGPRVQFGNLLVRGNDRTREDRIREIAGFPTGDVFSPDELRAVATRLRRTGAFRSVALTEASALSPGNTLDVEALLVEEKRRRLGYGAELSTVDGATLSAFWLHRNLFRGAERLRFDAEVSGIGGETGGIDYALGARLTRPATFDTDNTGYLDFNLERLDEPDFQTETVEIGAGIIRTVNDQFSVEAGVQLRYSNVTDVRGQQEFYLLNLPLKAIYDRRDDPLDATEGYFIEADATPFLGLSDTESGARVRLDGRGYFGFGEDNRLVLAGRAQIGSILGASLGGTPPDYLFYSGGGGTVRGQSYQSLGVDLGGGARSGGRAFAALSVEVRGKVSDKIGIVGFADYGYVGAESFPDGTGDSHAGAGLGVRYDTGIGPIRVDVAAPVSGGGEGVQIYVGIGQAF